MREELPAWLVLGVHGHAVADVIRRAGGLTADQVAVIAAQDEAEEQRLVREAWDGWLSMGASGSPVGCGLIAVGYAVQCAARATGLPLFEWDNEAGVEVLADPAWQQAGHAANAAALAVGAPEILGIEASQRMASRWTSVFDRS